MPIRCERIARDHRRRLRHAHSLRRCESPRQKPVRRLLAQRRAAGDKHFALPQTPRESSRTPACSQSSRTAIPAPCPRRSSPLRALALLQRPVQNALLHPMRLALDTLPDFLKHTRHRQEDRRPHLFHRRGQPVKPRQIGNRSAVRIDRVVQVPRQRVAQRQKRDRPIALRDVQVVRRVMQVVAEIPVRQHHALRIAGRAGRVDDRRQLLRLRLAELRIEGRIGRLQFCGAFSSSLLKLVAFGKLPSSKTTTRSSAGSSPALDDLLVLLERRNKAPCCPSRAACSPPAPASASDTAARPPRRVPLPRSQPPATPSGSR